MVHEAEANKEADDKRKEEVEVKNKAEQLISSIDESLSKEGVADNVKAEAKKIRDEMKEALDKNDIATLKSKIDELERQAAYAQQAAQQQTQAQPQPEASTSSEKKDDNVVDADFTEKK